MADGPIAADGGSGSGDGGGTTPADDRDHDGLSNDDEESLYGTDPDQRDTDGIYSEVDSSMGATGRCDLTARIMRGDVAFVLDTSLCVGQMETLAATTGSMTEPDRDGLHFEPAVVKWTTLDADSLLTLVLGPTRTLGWLAAGLSAGVGAHLRRDRRRGPPGSPMSPHSSDRSPSSAATPGASSRNGGVGSWVPVFRNLVDSLIGQDGVRVQVLGGRPPVLPLRRARAGALHYLGMALVGLYGENPAKARSAGFGRPRRPIEAQPSTSKALWRAAGPMAPKARSRPASW